MKSNAFSGSRVTSLMIALVVLLGALLPGAVLAQEDEPDVIWESYDVVVQVNEDGTLRVTETVLIDFNNAFGQGERTIPLDRIESISDVTVSIGPDLDSLEPATETRSSVWGDQAAFSVNYDVGGQTVIRYGFEPTSVDGIDSARAVRIAYTAHGAIRDYPDAMPREQQVRWMAISDEVTETGPVESASATIILPEPVAAEDLEIDPDATTVEADRILWEIENLQDGDSFQVAVAFPRMTDATAPAWQSEADTYEGRQEHLPAINLILGLVFLVGWVITILFMIVRGVRDSEVGLVADVIPERPDDLPAALVGTLVDESVETKDVLAGLLDLDRQGIVTIREEPALKAGKTDYQIVLNRPIDEAALWDRPMLEGLLGEDATVGEEVDLAKQLKKLRQKSFSEITKAYDEALFQRGYFIEHPHTTRLRWVGILIAMAFFSLALIAIPAIWAKMFSPLAVVATVVTGVGFIVGCILTTKAAVKTTEGAVEAAKWRAYGRYLEDLRKGPKPALFMDVLTRDLPWAVALGFDSSWSELADSMSTSTSTWEDDDRERRHHRGGFPVFVGGFGSGGDSGSSSSFGGGSLQGASGRALGAIGGGSSGIFSMLNDAAASINAGSSSSSGSSGGFSGSSSVGSSGGGGHSFS